MDFWFQETLMEIFASKTKELSDTENRFLAFNEKKERILVDTSENTVINSNLFLNYF